MNKTELIAAVAEQAELSKKDSEKALKAFVDVVTEELKKGEKPAFSIGALKYSYTFFPYVCQDKTPDYARFRMLVGCREW